MPHKDIVAEIDALTRETEWAARSALADVDIPRTLDEMLNTVFYAGGGFNEGDWTCFGDRGSDDCDNTRVPGNLIDLGEPVHDAFVSWHHHPARQLQYWVEVAWEYLNSGRFYMFREHVNGLALDAERTGPGPLGDYALYCAEELTEKREPLCWPVWLFLYENLNFHGE